MTTITREQLRERAREKVKSLEFAVTQTAFSENRAELEEELELARIALASLEAEPVGTFRKGPCGYSPSFHEDAMPLYAAPPAPVAVPECFKRLLHHAYGMTMGHDWNKGTMAGHHRAKLCQAVDECLAAMLQGADGTLTNEGTMQLSGNSEQIEPVSNRDELPLDYLQGHKDGLEWAAQLAEAIIRKQVTGYTTTQSILPGRFAKVRICLLFRLATIR